VRAALEDGSPLKVVAAVRRHAPAAAATDRERNDGFTSPRWRAARRFRSLLPVARSAAIIERRSIEQHKVPNVAKNAGLRRRAVCSKAPDAARRYEDRVFASPFDLFQR
jgi:hypothetical protein